MYFISITNIKTGSQHCVNIILCLNQNAAVFYSTAKCETDLHLIAEDRLLTKKNAHAHPFYQFVGIRIDGFIL
jgi:hypothetical protein